MASLCCGSRPADGGERVARTDLKISQTDEADCETHSALALAPRPMATLQCENSLWRRFRKFPSTSRRFAIGANAGAHAPVKAFSVPFCICCALGEDEERYL